MEGEKWEQRKGGKRRRRRRINWKIIREMEGEEENTVKRK
jgi:hypothetical protein